MRVILFLLCLLPVLAAYSQTDQIDNKRLATAFVKEVLNGKKIDMLDQLFAKDYVLNTAAGVKVNCIADSSLAIYIRKLYEAFPDLQYNIDQVVADGDKVALNLTATGTHRQTFLNYPATNNAVHFKEMIFFRMANNRIAEGWVVSDLNTLKEQIAHANP